MEITILNFKNFQKMMLDLVPDHVNHFFDRHLLVFNFLNLILCQFSEFNRLIFPLPVPILVITEGYNKVHVG